MKSQNSRARHQNPVKPITGELKVTQVRRKLNKNSRNFLRLVKYNKTQVLNPFPKRKLKTTGQRRYEKL